VVQAMADLSPRCGGGGGDPSRGDAGASVAVVRRLAGRWERQAELGAGSDRRAVMFAPRGRKRLVSADACAIGGEPGAMFELPGAAVAARRRMSHAVHDFRWDHALYAGEHLHGREVSAAIAVLVIEARAIVFGLELSHEVSIAVGKAIERIEQLLAQRGARP